MSTDTTNSQLQEHGEWNTVSSVYHDTVVRVTKPIAVQIVDWVNSNLSLTSDNTKILDNGCGTGIVCSVLKNRHPNIPLLASDSSAGMISTIRNHAKESRWTDFEAHVEDARDLASVETGSITHVFSTFMVCLAPDPDQIARELYRVLKPDGILGLAVWGDADFGFIADPWVAACRELDPGYEPPQLMPPEWTSAENVKKGLMKAGFKGVETRSEYQPWPWKDVDEFLNYFFGGSNPANLKWHASWTERGWSIDKVKPLFRRKLEEAYRQSDGSMEGPVSVCLAIGRK